MGSYAYKYCMCFTRKFRSPDAQPPPDVRAAHLSYCCAPSSSSDPQHQQGQGHAHGLRRFLSQVQAESSADVDRILAILAPISASHGIARLVNRSPVPAPPTLDDFFGFLFSPDLNPPITNQVRVRASRFLLCSAIAYYLLAQLQSMMIVDPPVWFFIYSPTSS